MSDKYREVSVGTGREDIWPLQLDQLHYLAQLLIWLHP